MAECLKFNGSRVTDNEGHKFTLIGCLRIKIIIKYSVGHCRRIFKFLMLLHRHGITLKQTQKPKLQEDHKQSGKLRERVTDLISLI